MKVIEMVGRKFGLLTVTGRNGSDDRGQAIWDCKCDCGGSSVVNGSSLRTGKTTSCGCRKREASVEARTTHGMTGSPTYGVWRQMLNRCLNHRVKSYANYGGRGIKVCARWAIFENFLADMGVKPDGMTIDRIDNDGHYEPGNCRWETRRAQARNRRSIRAICLGGETLCVAEWAERAGVSQGTILLRLRRGWTPEEAVHGRGRRLAENCKRGHQFTPENTYVTAGGTRLCRACKLARNTAYRNRLVPKPKGD